MDIVKQSQRMAVFIKAKNQKIIPVYPLSTAEHANQNVSRRLLLAFLLDCEPYQARYLDISPKRARESLERAAVNAGYILQEVDINE